MPVSRLTELMPTSFRPDLGILVSRWTQQPPTDALLPLYGELLEVARQYGACYWLQDIRHRVFNDPQTTRWLLDTYFAQVAGQLGGRLHVAYLSNPALLKAIVTGPDFQAPETYDNHPFVVAFFNDEGAAVAWLAQERAKEAAGQHS